MRHERCGDDAGARPSMREPQRLGPYLLCMQIGAGGMATVSLGRDDRRTGVHRFVAVKQIHGHLADDRQFVEMFLDEAQILSQIRHTNVCAVYDFGSWDGAHFLVMEYLAGETLCAVRTAMAQRTADTVSVERDAAVAARILADAAEGLHAAHELRDAQQIELEVVHRDVSPENVFVTYEGTAKVVDFGTLRAASQRHETESGMVKGKAAYLQPEVLRGAAPDRRADVWSLGVVAWELFTGQRLFKRKTDIESVDAVLRHPVPKVSTTRPGLPAALDDVLLRALARDPKERYPTARAFARDLVAAAARAGLTAGSGDVGDWLDELFPHGRACKAQLLALAAGLQTPTHSLSVRSAPPHSDEGLAFGDEAPAPEDSDGFAPTRCRTVPPPPLTQTAKSSALHEPDWRRSTGGSGARRGSSRPPGASGSARPAPEPLEPTAVAAAATGSELRAPARYFLVASLLLAAAAVAGPLVTVAMLRADSAPAPTAEPATPGRTPPGAHPGDAATLARAPAPAVDGRDDGPWLELWANVDGERRLVLRSRPGDADLVERLPVTDATAPATNGRHAPAPRP
ncbi:MAG: protein kinase [Myxococcales bacterium]|nr:protein kinase [Myxococcales bacterium]